MHVSINRVYDTLDANCENIRSKIFVLIRDKYTDPEVQTDSHERSGFATRILEKYDENLRKEYQKFAQNTSQALTPFEEKLFLLQNYNYLLGELDGMDEMHDITKSQIDDVFNKQEISGSDREVKDVLEKNMNDRKIESFIERFEVTEFGKMGMKLLPLALLYGVAIDRVIVRVADLIEKCKPILWVVAIGFVLSINSFSELILHILDLAHSSDCNVKVRGKCDMQPD